MAPKSLNGVRVLIVDDERLIRETLSELLQLDGAVVTEASDGNTAFDLIQAYDFHVVLSDIRMPECSGCLLYTSPSPRDGRLSRIPSSA